MTCRYQRIPGLGYGLAGEYFKKGADKVENEAHPDQSVPSPIHGIAALRRHKDLNVLQQYGKFDEEYTESVHHPRPHGHTRKNLSGMQGSAESTRQTYRNEPRFPSSTSH